MTASTVWATNTIDVTKVNAVVVDICDSQSRRLILQGQEIADLSGHPDGNAKNLVKNIVAL